MNNFVTLRASNNKEMNHYSTNLTDNQWQVIEKFLDVQVRKRKYSLRSLVNAIYLRSCLKFISN